MDITGHGTKSLALETTESTFREEKKKRFTLKPSFVHLDYEDYMDGDDPHKN